MREKPQAVENQLDMDETWRFLASLPKPRREWWPETFWARQARNIQRRLEEAAGAPAVRIWTWKPLLAGAAILVAAILWSRRPPPEEVRWIGAGLPIAENLEFLETLELWEYLARTESAAE